jgi:uncharacterized membrane protein
MATAFVVRHGAADPTLRVAPQVPASLYYALPALFERWFGSSELVYRVPSVLAMLAALGFIARIAARLIHRQAAWFAVFACLALHDFSYQAADARPYALGTLVAAAGIWCLIRWLDRGRWGHALAFAAAAALLWRVHLIFWPAYLLFFLYAAFRLWRGQVAPRFALQAGVVATVVAGSLIPVLAQALALQRQAGRHVVAALPQASDLSEALKPAFILAFIAGAALAARWFDWPKVRSAPAGSALLLIAGWWLCQPLCLFVYSHAMGDSVFLERYLSLALPGVALMATQAAAIFIPPRFWNSCALALGIAVLLLPGHWTQLWPAHHKSGWRTAAQILNSRIERPETPVLCPSPFIEALPPVWRPGYPLGSFLYSHLLYYPVRGTTYPFPYEDSSEAESYATRLTSGTLANSGRFFLYGAHTVQFWTAWFRIQPELRGWRIERLGPFGDVDVIEFDRHGP